MSSPRIFSYCTTSPEIICLAMMMYVQYPLSLRNFEDLLHERGIGITHETVRFWGTGSAQSSQPRSDGIGFRRCGPSGIGDGISMRSS